MRVRLVVDGHVEGLLEDGDHVGAVRRTDEVEGTADLLDELVPAGGGLLVHVYFVGNDHAGDVGTLLPHFLVPVLQVLIRDFPIRVEHQDARVRPEVVRRVQLIEGVLPSRVPNVCPVY